TFSLDSFIPSTARIDIRVAIDNEMTNVFLNGAATGLSHIGFDALSPVKTMSSGFVTGNNTLEFRTLNYDGPGPNPGGFRAVVAGSGLQANTNNPPPVGNTTYYFRKAFIFSGNPRYTQLRLNTVVADGAVFYLNGI